ncbi:MAG: SpoIIE family protein phosphatase [Pseudomonadota bacterium]
MTQAAALSQVHSLVADTEEKRVLIVEDAPDIRVKIAAMMDYLGYEVIEAEDGERAWEIYRQDPLRLVITDWMMPGMSGVELCEKIRSHASSRYTYVILMTSLDDDSSVVEGFNRGADDYVSKNITTDILYARISAGERIIELQSRLHERNEELSKAYSTIESGLKAAADTQQRLLPENDLIINGYHFNWNYIPSEFISGDTLNCFPLGKNEIGFYNIDVAGHGISAALLSVTIHQFITSKLLEAQLPQISNGQPTEVSLNEPAKFVRLLNDTFTELSSDSEYFTVLYGTANVDTATLKLCQAGHPNPMLANPSGDITIIGEGGFPVGLMPDIDYEEFTVPFEKGARLYVYSDGVIEACNAQGEMFGEDRLINAIDGSARRDEVRDMAAIQADLHKWCGSEQFDDDVSMFTLECR